MTARRTGRAGAKAGLSDPAVPNGRAVAYRIKATLGITGLSPPRVNRAPHPSDRMMNSGSYRWNPSGQYRGKRVCRGDIVWPSRTSNAVLTPAREFTSGSLFADATFDTSLTSYVRHRNDCESRQRPASAPLTWFANIRCRIRYASSPCNDFSFTDERWTCCALA